MNPFLSVCDIDTVISWYKDFLGFKCIYKSKLKQPEFATLEKDDQRIYLAQDPEMESYAANIFIIETDNIQKSFDEAVSKGCIIMQEIGEGFWSQKQFLIKDYEDNKIVFVQKA